MTHEEEIEKLKLRILNMQKDQEKLILKLGSRQVVIEDIKDRIFDLRLKIEAEKENPDMSKLLE